MQLSREERECRRTLRAIRGEEKKRVEASKTGIASALRNCSTGSNLSDLGSSSKEEEELEPEDGDSTPKDFLLEYRTKMKEVTTPGAFPSYLWLLSPCDSFQLPGNLSG